MDEELYRLVKRLYERHGASADTFGTMLSIAGGAPGPAGSDAFRDFENDAFGRVLECLERCVVEKRLSWLRRNAGDFTRSGDALVDGFRMFYETYLGLSIPRDGEIVSATDGRLVTRWWNRCPALEACLETGLDTRLVCKKVYEKPVQVFLSRVDPRLRFRRDYDALRPYGPYCEEIIEIGSDPGFDRRRPPARPRAGAPVQDEGPK